MRQDKKFLLQVQDNSYWVSTVHHKGWAITEEFIWKSTETENTLIEWLERLIKEKKISIADAIRVGVYYGR